tara:strand:+ start:178 stop:684 length:507 start_codon:yes stop_codon:yes gene_type:complete
MLVSYALTPQEEATAVEVGYQRQKPYLGDPTRNVNYSEGDLWELWQHAVAAGSELAFARMIGRNDFTPHFNKWKTELDIPGLGEVRYTFSEQPKLRFTNKDNETLIYILMADGMRHKTRRVAPDWLGVPYKALGWIYGAECKKEEFRYNEKSWYVPVSHLQSMHLLSL